MDTFEIRVASHLEERRARRLGCAAVTTLPDGTSLLRFVARDQTAVYGLLARLRDLGVALISIEPAPARSGATEDQQ